jgi:hypothetical protein
MTFVRSCKGPAIGDAYAAAPHGTHATKARGPTFSQSAALVLSVSCPRAQLVPAAGHTVLRGSRLCAFAQAYGLHGLPPLGVVCECHKSPPILRISERS